MPTRSQAEATEELRDRTRKQQKRQADPNRIMDNCQDERRQEKREGGLNPLKKQKMLETFLKVQGINMRGTCKELLNLQHSRDALNGPAGSWY